MSVQFFRCKKCGKIVEAVQGSACPTMCCGEEMVLLKANTTDGASEKHVPVVIASGNSVEVRVGSAAHPMEADHWIQFVVLETKRGVQRAMLNPGDEPRAAFALADGDSAVAAYEYCNKHGLWKADL